MSTHEASFYSGLVFEMAMKQFQTVADHPDIPLADTRFVSVKKKPTPAREG